MTRVALRRVCAGLYTTTDQRIRVENLRACLADPSLPNSWEVYLQHPRRLDIRGIDSRASFLRSFDRLTDARRFLS